jgi:hypothetical protein
MTKDKHPKRIKIGRIEIDPSEVQPGPIRHVSLSPELLRELKHLYDHVGRYVQPTLEQWELGFMRDEHPEREVSVWRSISKAYTDYKREHLGGKRVPDKEAGDLIGSLSAISTGITDAKRLNLPERVAARLVECFVNAWNNQ